MYLNGSVESAKGGGGTAQRNATNRPRRHEEHEEQAAAVEQVTFEKKKKNYDEVTCKDCGKKGHMSKTFWSCPKFTGKAPDHVKKSCAAREPSPAPRGRQNIKTRNKTRSGSANSAAAAENTDE